MNNIDKTDLYKNYLETLGDYKLPNEHVSKLYESLEILKISMGMHDVELIELEKKLKSNFNDSIWNGSPEQMMINSYIQKVKSKTALFAHERVNMVVCILSLLDDMGEAFDTIDKLDKRTNAEINEEKINRLKYVYGNDLRFEVTEMGEGDFKKGLKKLKQIALDGEAHAIKKKIKERRVESGDELNERAFNLEWNALIAQAKISE